jgi:succinoglycan biosynthesis protein ExoV
MELLYYKDVKGNFGDDLNEVIWRAVLPREVFDVPDVILVGIGSILNATTAPLSKTMGRRVFVLGSGASYGALPSGWETWSILAVRGPLTAQLIGRQNAAATDGAALIATMPSLIGEYDRRDLTLFMPHHHSIAAGLWERVADTCGFTFVSPEWPVSKIVALFARAKLVVTEAMHGAIVADAMRIPWIPVVMSPDISVFKWSDWTMSLNLPFRPTTIPGSSSSENRRHRSILKLARERGYPPPSLADTSSADALVRDHHQRHEAGISDVGPKCRQSTVIRRVAKQLVAVFDPLLVERAADSLTKLNLANAWLSDDLIMRKRVEQLQEATALFVKQLLN